MGLDPDTLTAIVATTSSVAGSITGSVAGLVAGLRKAAKPAPPSEEDQAAKKQIEHLTAQLAWLNYRFEQMQRSSWDWQAQVSPLEARLGTIESQLESLRDAAGLKTDVQQLRSKLFEVEALVHRVRDRMAQYVKTDTFHAFSSEQREQWLELQRNLGQIEGALKRLG